MGGLADIIGQDAVIKRLHALELYCAKRGAELGHVLLVGPNGTGKRTIALSLAEQLAVPIKLTSGKLLERKGDLTAILTALDTKEVLFLEDVHDLPRGLEEILQPALTDFRIDLVIGQGPGARVHPFTLNRFTCILSAPAESSVPRGVREAVALTLRLGDYSLAELAAIASQVSARHGISLELGGTHLLARSCDGVPGRLEGIIRQLVRTQQGAVSSAAVAEFLSAHGIGPEPSANPEGLGTLELESGVEFEKAVAALLARMGFSL